MSSALAVHHGPFGRAALYRLDRTIATHAHREGHLIFHVEGPPCAVTVGRRTIPLGPRGAVAVSPWRPHAFHAPEGGCVLTLVLYVKPAWFLEFGRTARFAMSFGRSAVEMTDDLRERTARIGARLLDDPGSDLFEGWLHELTRVCLDQSWQWSDDASPLLSARGAFRDWRVRRSLRIMEDDLACDLDLAGVARAAGLSRPHFFKLFRQHMGVTPNLYLNTLRAERAIDDLTGSAKTVADIAAEVGFSSQASFSRFFASNVGIPPSEYRRAARTLQ